ncbi:hypothetical protein M9H77_08109 [Catharanthus roseus]|uniref:Uncharacterized protein n=1 Tax=Catharanthus roseus TaxID=4058 RepID=A0ACC0BX50_CATRO|nr:hypothetical protein M9H77_08109 [Catharanthus roseus]
MSTGFVQNSTSNEDVRVKSSLSFFTMTPKIEPCMNEGPWNFDIKLFIIKLWNPLYFYDPMMRWILISSYSVVVAIPQEQLLKAVASPCEKSIKKESTIMTINGKGDTADSDVKVRKGVDKENAIVGGESQHKRVSTFKKMARLTTTAMGTPIRDPIEPIISTEQNTDTFPQKRALDDSSCKPLRLTNTSVIQTCKKTTPKRFEPHWIKEDECLEVFDKLWIPDPSSSVDSFWHAFPREQNGLVLGSFGLQGIKNFMKVDYGKPLAIIEGYNTGSVIHFKRWLVWMCHWVLGSWCYKNFVPTKSLVPVLEEPACLRQLELNSVALVPFGPHICPGLSRVVGYSSTPISLS